MMDSDQSEGVSVTANQTTLQLQGRRFNINIKALYRLKAIVSMVTAHALGKSVVI